MSSKEDQSKAGIPERRRGQQTGEGEKPTERMADKNLEDMEETPALRGERKEANEFFADDSSQQVGSNPVTPRSNTPSTPAAIPSGQPLGQSGGEKEFKQRIKQGQAKK